MVKGCCCCTRRAVLGHAEGVVSDRLDDVPEQDLRRERVAVEDDRLVVGTVPAVHYKTAYTECILSVYDTVKAKKNTARAVTGTPKLNISPLY